MSLTRKEQTVVLLSTGCQLGTYRGATLRNRFEREKGSNHLERTMYVVKEEDDAGFKATWNDLSRLAQRQPGYEYTRMYKAVTFNDVPYQYMSVRMWNTEEMSERFKQSPTAKELLERLEKYSTSRTSIDEVVIDDSVKRMIY